MPDPRYVRVPTTFGDVVVKVFILPDHLHEGFSRLWWQLRDVQSFVQVDGGDYVRCCKWLLDRWPDWEKTLEESWIGPGHLVKARARCRGQQRRAGEGTPPSFDEHAVSTYGLLFLLSKWGSAKASSQKDRSRAFVEGLIHLFIGDEWSMKAVWPVRNLPVPGRSLEGDVVVLPVVRGGLRFQALHLHNLASCFHAEGEDLEVCRDGLVHVATLVVLHHTSRKMSRPLRQSQGLAMHALHFVAMVVDTVFFEREWHADPLKAQYKSPARKRVDEVVTVMCMLPGCPERPDAPRASSATNAPRARTRIPRKKTKKTP